MRELALLLSLMAGAAHLGDVLATGALWAAGSCARHRMVRGFARKLNAKQESPYSAYSTRGTRYTVLFSVRHRARQPGTAASIPVHHTVGGGMLGRLQAPAARPAPASAPIPRQFRQAAPQGVLLASAAAGLSCCSCVRSTALACCAARGRIWCCSCTHFKTRC